MKTVGIKRLLSSLILATVTAVVMNGSAMAADDSGLLAKVTDRGSLRIGIEGTYPPFNYRDGDGKLTGFEVDFARALSKRLGVKADFVLTEWAGMLAGLESKRLDVVINQVTITPDRRKKYDFTVPYTYSGLQILVKKGTQGINGPDDLDGKRVGVGLGTDHEQWLKANQPGATAVTYQDNASELQDLKVGRIDAIVNDRLMMSYLVNRSGGNFQAVGQLFKPQEAGIALRKGHPKFLAALNKAINAMKADGELAKISQKWFGIDVSKR